tara:strand:- start:910 stop:2829 length:1920 start_codon:yes stop_codon:yes gene_type:complete
MAGTEFEGTATGLVAEEYRIAPEEVGYSTYSMNPYIYPFVNSIITARSLDESDSEVAAAILGKEYAEAYGYLIENMFSYIASNGAFDKAKLNNLKFFKNNSNCAPENIGDLFDSEGILDQMKKEFAMAACHDTGTNQDKVRNTLYFGLLMMMVQAIIDEFIVKNIIVFTAFKMDEILSPAYPFKEFMVNEMVKSFNEIAMDGNSVLEREIYNYFNRLSRRPSTLERGGITHSHDPETLIPGFEDGEFPVGGDALVKFLVEERLGYTWMDGDVSRSTIRAIQNIIEPGENKKSIDDIFVEDILLLYRTPLIDMQDLGTIMDATTPFSHSVLLHEYEGNVVGYLANPQKNTPTTRLAELFSFDVPADLNDVELRNEIKSNPVYQTYMNQTFNKNAILMAPITYNFVLTERYFSDIVDSFRGTKRAIINFMNMTDASSRPPLPNRPNNDYVNSLAAGDMGPDLESMAREIFLKFLKETPLMILKGLVELIDPHVAISKIIRDITGEVFLKISQAMTTSIQATPGPLADSGITGEDLFGLLLCLYNIGNEATSSIAIPDTIPNSGDPGNSTEGAQNQLLFGPRMNLNGVDFKGTIAGMFMIPPSPMGIIYILLEMLKALIDTLPPGDEEETIEDASTSTENEC